MRQIEDLRILYLAQYADRPLVDETALHPEDGVFIRYHSEVRRSLSALGATLLPTRQVEDLLDTRDEYDYVFSLLNKANFRGAEIFVSAMCEYLAKPYLGAPPHIRALASDKRLAKLLARHNGIPTPDWVVCGPSTKLTATAPFEGPYFVKPRFGSASRGIGPESIVETWVQLLDAPAVQSPDHGELIIEKFVQGKNLTVGILGGNPPLVLPVVETRSTQAGNVESYRQKRLIEGGNTRTITPVGEKSRTIQSLSLDLFGKIQPADYARFDFRWGESGPSFLEFNICCNLGSHSTIATPARELGMSHVDLIERILLHSLHRQNVLG